VTTSSGGNSPAKRSQTSPPIESGTMRHIAFAAFPAVLVCVLTACTDRPSPVEPVSVAPAEAQGPPTDLDPTPFLINRELFGPGACAFDILAQQSGKVKEIVLPGGRTIFIFPANTITLTNPANQKQETFVITGSFHQTLLENGDLVTVATGRNALLDPEAGFVISIGNFSFVFDATGNLIQPLQGTGQLIDICELLA
jgi:hypothetical protein